MAFISRLRWARSWSVGSGVWMAWGVMSGCGFGVTRERLNDDSSERQSYSPLQTDTPEGDGGGSDIQTSSTAAYLGQSDDITERTRVDADGGTEPRTAYEVDGTGLIEPLDEVTIHDADAGASVLASSGPSSEASSTSGSSTNDAPADGGTIESNIVASALELCEPAALEGAVYAEDGQLGFEQRAQPKQVTGEGYFVAAYADDPRLHYARRTRVSVAPHGTLEGEGGEVLLGFASSVFGETTCLSPLQAPIAFAPVATSLVSIRANLDAGEPISSFDVDNPADSHVKTTIPVVDGLGKVRLLEVYFTKTADGVFEYHVLVDGLELAGGAPGQLIDLGSGTLTFDSYGRLADAQTPDISVDFDQATPRQVIAIDFGLDILNDASDGSHATTSHAEASAVNFQSNDGWTAGTASQMTINVLGEVTIEYDNRRKQVIGTLALARFPDEAELVSDGADGWLQSATSGAPAVALPLAAGYGIVESEAEPSADTVVDGARENLAFTPRPWMLCDLEPNDGFIYWSGKTFLGEPQSIAVDGPGYLVGTWPEVPLFHYSTNAVLSVAPDGSLVDAAGHAVLGFAGANGDTSCLSAFRLPNQSKPAPTTRVVITGNLDADATVGEGTPQLELDFEVVDHSGWMSKIHLTFIKVDSGHWTYTATSDRARMYGLEGVEAGAGALYFDEHGALFDAQTPSLQVGFRIGETIELNVGADIGNDGGSGIDGITSFPAPSVVAKVERDGFGWGNATGWRVDAGGDVYVQFDSGLVAKFGTLALARFPSEQHLTLGPDATWRETLASGAPTFERALVSGAWDAE